MFTGTEGSAGLYAQGRGQTCHLWILDVGGQRVLILYVDHAATPAADQAAAEAIIDSMVLEP